MPYWVKQYVGGSWVQVEASSAQDAVEKGEAWEKDGPVIIVTDDGMEYALDQFRKLILGGVKGFSS